MEPSEHNPKHALHAYDPVRGLPPTEEAAAAMESSLADPELRRWWENEQAFDRSFAAKVRAVPVPAGLAERILQAARDEQAETAAQITPPTAAAATRAPRQNLFHWSAFSAAAAAVVIAALFFTFVFQRPATPEQAYSPQLASIVGGVENILRERSATMKKADDYNTLVNYLQQGGAPAPRMIPRGLSEEHGFACATLVVDGVRVGMMCFELDNAVYHIFSINRSDMPEQGDLPQPVFTQINEHCCATWTTEEQVHILATKAPEEKVLTLL